VETSIVRKLGSSSWSIVRWARFGLSSNPVDSTIALIELHALNIDAGGFAVVAARPGRLRLLCSCASLPA